MTSEERQRLSEEAQRHYQFAKEATYAAEATAEAAQSQAASLLVIADCLANGTYDDMRAWQMTQKPLVDDPTANNPAQAKADYEKELRAYGLDDKIKKGKQS